MTLSDDLRAEANIAARPDQYARLLALANLAEEHRRHCTANTCCLEVLDGSN